MTKKQQVCYPTADGFLVCNCIMRRGVCVETKSGKWWKFRLLKRLYKQKRPKKPTVEDGVTKTATTSEK